MVIMICAWLLLDEMWSQVYRDMRRVVEMWSQVGMQYIGQSCGFHLLFSKIDVSGCF